MKIALSAAMASLLLSMPAAASDDAVLRRLDALEKQNAALRDRVRQLETGSHAKPSSHARVVAAAPATPVPVRASSFTADYEPFSWAGFHVGGFAGADLFAPLYSGGTSETSSSNLTQTTLSGGAGSTPTVGALYGANAGHDWQRGSLVYGIEGDAAGIISGVNTSGYTQNANYLGEVQGAYSKTQAIATLRARFGVAVDRVLIYGTIGGAAVRAKTMISTGISTGYFVGNGWTPALAIGGGIDYAITDHWIINGEALYLAAGTEHFSATIPAAFGTPSYTQYFGVTPSQALLKAGVGYKF